MGTIFLFFLWIKDSVGFELVHWIRNRSKHNIFTFNLENSFLFNDSILCVLTNDFPLLKYLREWTIVRKDFMERLSTVILQILG